MAPPATGTAISATLGGLDAPKVPTDAAPPPRRPPGLWPYRQPPGGGAGRPSGPPGACAPRPTQCPRNMQPVECPRELLRRAPGLSLRMGRVSGLIGCRFLGQPSGGLWDAEGRRGCIPQHPSPTGSARRGVVGRPHGRRRCAAPPKTLGPVPPWPKAPEAAQA